MTYQGDAIRAKVLSASRGKRKQATGTVRVKDLVDPRYKSMSHMQTKVSVPPFTDGPLGLGLLAAPPKPVKR
jgi:hypothetical protein